MRSSYVRTIAAAFALVAIGLVNTAAALGTPGPPEDSEHPIVGHPRQTDDTDADTDTGGSSTAIELHLVDQQFAIDPNGEIRLDYRLTGLVGDPLELIAAPPPPEPEPVPNPPAIDAGAEPLPEPAAEPEPPVALTLEITNYAALSDPLLVSQLVGNSPGPANPGVLGSAIDGVAIDARPSLTRNDDGTVDITLSVGTDVADSVEDRLKFERPGIYPIRIQLLLGDPDDDNVIATAGTVVQRLAGAVDFATTVPPPIHLSVLALTAPPPPDASADELDAARAELDRAIMLAAALDAPVTLAVAPGLIAERSSSPAESDALTTALANDELVALPIVPLDVSSAVGADRADAYTRLVRAGEDLLAASVPTISSPRDVWISGDVLSAGGAQHLRDLGRRVVIMPPTVFSDTVDVGNVPTDRFVNVALGNGGTLSLLVVGAISEELTETAADRILAEHTAVEWGVAALAEVLVGQSVDDAASGVQAPRRSLILTTPDLEGPDARLLQALERLVATTTAVRFTATSALFGVTDVATVDGAPLAIELPDTAGPSLADRVERIDATAFAMASVASMLPPDDRRPDTWTTELDTLISTAYSDEDVVQAADALLGQAASIKDAVQLPEPFTFTLTGRSGTIQIRIINTADVALDVAVELDSEKVTFPEGPQQVTLLALGETSVNVPVDAKSNGTSSIALRVSTPAGELLGDEVALTARVTALTGLGQVLTGGLIVVVLTWWFSHWRGRRRAALIDGRDRHPSTGELESDPL